MTTLDIPALPELVTVTVDGNELQLPKGKNLLQALLDANIYIPHYCYHPCLSIAGNCRLCLIEIEGRPKPEVSCNMVVTDGLKIKANSPLVHDCRKGMMEFLLVNHPLDCPICDRGGECMLQRYSMDYGFGTARTVDDRRRFPKPQLDRLIDIERNRCIMCTRCVRFCDEVAGDHVMGIFGHGNRNYIGTFGNGPVSNVFSGNVIDICPVGCLTSKPFRFKARAWELRQTATTTRQGIGAVTSWTRDGWLYRVTPPVRLRHGLYTIDEDTDKFISNELRFGSMYTNNRERLLQPLVRIDGKLQSASWELALARAAEALREGGAEATAILAGERSTNEEFFLLSRLARGVLGTSAIDWRSRWTSPAGAEAAGVALAASDGDFDLLAKKAYGATLLINADLLGSAPDIALRIKEAARLGRTRLGLLDARLDPWMLKHAAAANLEQPEALAAAVTALAAALEAAPADAADRATAKAPAGFEALFALLAGNKQGLIVLGVDNAGGALNPPLVAAALRLARALGDSWHFMAVTAARNAKGAVAAGAQADRLAGGPIAAAEAAQRAESSWGEAPRTTGAGVVAPALLRQAAQGKFKTLLLHLCDELVTHPQRELIERALAATPHVIAIDLFPSWITDHAEIVLPASTFFENDGSMTDIDGSLQRMTLGARPAGEAQEPWRIIESLAGMLGAKKRFRTASDVFAELGRAWNAPELRRLDDLLLESPGTEAPQRHHTHVRLRTRPTWKVQFTSRPELAIAPVAAAVPAQGDMLRLLWIQHAQGPDHLGSHSEVFDALRPRPRVEINPADATRLGLAQDDWVVLEGGAAEPSQITVRDTVAPGVVFGAANVLGLRLAAESESAAPALAPELPRVRLIKTAAPVPAAEPNTEEVEVR